MDGSMTLMDDRYSCDFCDAGAQDIVSLCWKGVGDERQSIVYICLSCLLKAVGLLEMELDLSENESEPEEETKVLEAEKFSEGLLSPPLVVEQTKKGG